MKDGLLERIRSFGHWRVNLRPLRPIAEKLSLRQCHDEVDRARVSIRGWDFPHMNGRDDDMGGTERASDYYENWCDWHSQIEFWRMYRSGQFLAYKALHEDTAGPQGLRADARVLDVIDAVYTISEFIEFGHRLSANGLYADGFEAIVSLEGSDNRPLWAGPRRMPFFDALTTRSPSVRVERTIGPADLQDGAIEPALAILLELFDRFGWNPDPHQIRSTQESFYRRDFR